MFMSDPNSKALRKLQRKSAIILGTT
uniref:Uncharacterized protein n=1 Tax=Rhizophora mucronata TaxID=61149 RepID=A0A2P2P2E3_RHIMU